MEKEINMLCIDEFDEYNDCLRKVIGTHEPQPRIVLDDIPGRLSYRRGIPKFGTHEGQRKLLLSEIQFLTGRPEKYVIYAGSAPGNKNKFLHKLFPDKKLIMIDPNPFLIRYGKRAHYEVENDILYFHFGGFHPHVGKKTYANINFYNYETKEITNNMKAIKNMKDYMGHIDDILEMIRTSDFGLFIINDFFTVELAEAFVALGDSVFISDIRTNMGKAVDEVDFPTDWDILFNSAQMFNWVRALGPSSSMLKFRVPYFQAVKGRVLPDMVLAKEAGYDVVGDYQRGIYRFFDGTVYLQAFAGKSSTETRLVFDGVPDLVEYDVEEYEQKLMYFNSFDRSVVLFDNPKENIFMKFDRCHDCALERHIWTQYLGHDNVETMISRLNRVLPRDKDHGFMFDVSTTWIKRMQKRDALTSIRLDLRTPS